MYGSDGEHGDNLGLSMAVLVRMMNCCDAVTAVAAVWHWWLLGRELRCCASCCDYSFKSSPRPQRA